MHKPIRSVFLTIAIAVTVAVVFYTATYTATSDPAVRPYAAAIAIALLAILVVQGLIDPGRADSGLLASAFSLLPRVFQWGNANGRAAAALGLILLAAGLATIWLGPLGVRTYAIACDDAAEIQISARSSRASCEAAITETLWLTPIQRFRPLGLTCFDARGNPWAGVIAEDTNGRCGARPIDASYVRNGIAYPTHDPETVSGRRLVAGIDRLRTALSDAGLPDRRAKDRLLFATWSIRDLGENSLGYGPRLEESYAFIAEVISHFDIVAVQELRDPAALEKILSYLGQDYRAEFSLVSPGRSGNRERLGFIYDSRKIAFGDVSTTIVLDQVGIERSTTGQPARPPFMAEFMLNGRRFFIVTAHVYFGGDEGPRFERRIAELKAIARGVDGLADRYYTDHPVILAGDLNVSRPNGQEMAALTENGFQTDSHLASASSNFTDTYPYDQIMVRSAHADELAFGKSGVFKVLDYVFRSDEWDEYRIDLTRTVNNRRLEGRDGEAAYQQIRTWQISDHHVKWAEFRIDW